MNTNSIIHSWTQRSHLEQLKGVHFISLSDSTELTLVVAWLEGAKFHIFVRLSGAEQISVDSSEQPTFSFCHTQRSWLFFYIAFVYVSTVTPLQTSSTENNIWWQLNSLLMSVIHARRIKTRDTPVCTFSLVCYLCSCSHALCTTPGEIWMGIDVCLPHVLVSRLVFVLLHRQVQSKFNRRWS